MMIEHVQASGNSIVRWVSPMTAARGATALAVLYALPHLWWGLGVDWPAPADTLRKRNRGGPLLARPGVPNVVCCAG
jgi:hypothetical protein